MTLWWTTTPMVTAVCILSLTSLSRAQEQIQKCTYSSEACGCETEKGYINLKKFESKPLYVLDPVQYTEYHWNPCKDFKMGKIESACIQHLLNGDEYDCGSHSSTKSSVEQGNAVFSMVSSDRKRTSKVTCVCKKYAVDDFAFSGEYPSTVYGFQLSGDSCCPEAVPPSSSSTGLSPGSILLIAFLVLVVVYILVGVGIQIGVRKAKGIESLPNVSFWSALPGLIKDGVGFTLTCGKKSEYNKI
ncbi:hypothetical protein EGW08_009786 [Elysia chlorotica]|uniref:Cation-dependent mannose-6-phosphate receptor n=1 Tax=Elysia chlorotica TaxID=188477 RepID=A0A3S1HMI0_ELYCH|nr:hypothetical protein EGW08_009786 [Elysia chlorotica]